MQKKNKKKILRFFSIFLILSTLLVVFAFPIGALDLGNGSTIVGVESQLWMGSDGPYPGGIYYEGNPIEQDENQISYSFNVTTLTGYNILSMSNVSYYSFNSLNNYGTFSFSIKNEDSLVGIGSLDMFEVRNTDTNKKVPVTFSVTQNNYTVDIVFNGFIPKNFYVYTTWLITPPDYPVQRFITFDLKFVPGDQVAGMLGQEQYPSFGDSQDKIDSSQQIEDDSLNNANGFIDNTADFVFDRSLFTEGNFINGLRVASTTFENFASIPFIGTILKYAVIFGLIGFVLGLATFVMRRRN